MTYGCRRFEWPTPNVSYLERLHTYYSNTVSLATIDATKELVHNGHSKRGGEVQQRSYDMGC